SSRRRHTRFSRDWSSDVCSSDLAGVALLRLDVGDAAQQRQVRAQVAVRAPFQALQALLAVVAQSGEPPTLVGADEGWSLDLEGRSEERRVGKECRSRWVRTAAQE